MKFFIPILICITLPILSHTYPPNIISVIDKRLYYASFVLVSLLLLFKKNFENSNQVLENKILLHTDKISDKFYYLILTLFVLITQNFLLNFETLSWDIPTYLVATYDVAQGNLPYTTQWETKGPLLVYIYYFLSLISGKSYILFRIANDFVLLFIAIILYKIAIILSEGNKLTAFSSSLLFLSIFGMRWYISEFSELYCLVFLSLSYMFLISSKVKTLKKIFFIGFFISLSSLINQVSILFIIPVMIYMYLESELKKKNFYYLVFGAAIPQMIFLTLYLINGQLDVYIFNYFILPFTYVGSTGVDKNLLYEFTVWLREIFNYESFVYFSIFSIVCLNFIQLFKYKISQISNFNLLFYLSTLFGFAVYFIGGWGFAHHLIYFIFFFSFLLTQIINNKSKVFVFCLVLISAISIFSETYQKSSYNLSNLRSLEENYPLFKLSNEIANSFDKDEEFEVFALEYVLVLYYLEKPNFSYIIHPTNHFQDYITDTLTKYKKIEIDNVNYLLQKNPEVILCNPERIHMGKVLKNENFSCNFEDYKDTYRQLDTKKYREDKNIEFYFDKYKKLNVFIKDKSK